MAGQSDPHLSIFSAAEVEFLAEDELVEIIPNMSMDSLNFICVIYLCLCILIVVILVLFPHIPTEVPIWLAMALKRGKCAIRPPNWMSLEFQPLPFHYVEISRLLFDHARDDIPDVRTLVEDIRDVRFHKVESGFRQLVLVHMQSRYLNIVRPFFVRALQAFYKHDSPQMIPQPDTASRTNAGDRPRRDLRPR
ncbi:hypothetical protein MKW92_000543 [Papaver armeniacum]|nr:hypothetical protein MKW92_000543 [Papaver armeniacum]